jgi:GntR family transcriptional regulator
MSAPARNPASVPAPNSELSASYPDAGDGLRYLRIAADLRAEIMRGEYPVGASLPTEAQLCARFGVSRHTVREALRRLVESGLVERRQGAGTRVIATAPKAAYVHSLGSLFELFQYTRETRLHIAEMEVRPLAPEEAEDVPAQAGSRWLRISGVRRTVEQDEPIAFSVVLVHGRFAAVLSDLREWTGPVYVVIEQRTGELVMEARQVITGGPMPAHAARALGRRPGSPGIRVIRRYLDMSGGPMLTSLNWHPADRFTYAVTLHRDPAH